MHFSCIYNIFMGSLFLPFTNCGMSVQLFLPFFSLRFMISSLAGCSQFGSVAFLLPILRRLFATNRLKNIKGNGETFYKGECFGCLEMISHAERSAKF